MRPTNLKNKNHRAHKTKRPLTNQQENKSGTAHITIWVGLEVVYSHNNIPKCKEEFGLQNVVSDLSLRYLSKICYIRVF